MIFSKAKSANKRKLMIKSLEDSAFNNRKVIERMLNEAKDVDQQLAKVLSETRELTTSISQKISSRLKITQKTLKTMVMSIKEGIVILDYRGVVLETNGVFEKTFLNSDSSILNINFKELCGKLEPCTEDGKRFVLTPNFLDLSPAAFNREDKAVMVIQPEIILEVHPKESEPFKCIFSLSILDNDPENVDDVSFILFFKCLKRSADRDRRSSERNTSPHNRVNLCN